MKLKWLRRPIPEPIKVLLRPIINLFKDRYASELSFWRSKFEEDNRVFKNEWYQRLMLAIAEQNDDEFLRGKIVADFGCGPRGSLVWAKSASLRIGIDVLADRYSDEFSSNIIDHGMIYLKSTEKVIPLPSDFVDVMFTLNALDHVKDFSAICREIIRVIKPEGLFIGSFNLEEPPTPTEPQSLNEEIIRKNLLNFLEVQSYRVTNQITNEGDNGIYSPFFDGSASYQQGQKGILWVKAKLGGKIN